MAEEKSAVADVAKDTAKDATKRATIWDVAELAGVSKQTVSRVVNESERVAPETRRTVQEAIAKLGYRPNALARQLIRGRSFTLGLVGINRNYLISEASIGISGQAQTLGYSILLKQMFGHGTEEIEPMLHSLLDHQVDGILWMSPEIGTYHPWLDNSLLAGVSVPTVFMNGRPREGTVVVGFDNAEGGRVATQHLIDRGRQHIGHISGPLNWWVSQQRLEGWKSALQGAGLAAGNKQIVEGTWLPESGATAMASLLQDNPKLDAVFVAGDRMALGAMKEIRRQGLRIPQDIAIVGFDNSTESAYLEPSLTTVAQDKKRLGEVAISTLVQCVEARLGDNPSPNSNTILPLELIVREST
ncbi:MAG TPA: LacI family DNA-binding transcriptional regulator [Rhodocyclaceae bacterium]|nr:LacI family DNA-binding transcriptional regulator [Rhodocyclaceae bacterium]